MSTPSATTVELFTPAFATGVERLQPTSDRALLYHPRGAYLRLDADETKLVTRIDGARSLRQLLLDSAQDGHVVSIKRVVTLAGKLARGGWLANDPKTVAEAGLGVVRPETRNQSVLSIVIALHLFGPLARFLLWPLFWLPTQLPVIAGAATLLVVAGVVFARAISWPFGADPLFLMDSYELGMVAVYVGAVWALSCRQVLRGAVLARTRVGVFAAGIEARFFVLGPYVDGRHVARAGPRGELELVVAGLLGQVFATVSLAASVFYLYSDEVLAHGLALATVGALAVTYGNFCPLLGSDLGHVIDLTLPSREGRRHALSYLRKRLFARATKDFFVGEKHHIAVGVTTILWVYLGFSWSAHVLSSQLVGAFRLLTRGQPLDLVVLAVMIGLPTLLMVMTAFLFLSGLLGSVAGHLPRRRQGPRRGATAPIHAGGVEPVLRQSGLFGKLSEVAIGELAKVVVAESFKPGAELMRQGEEGSQFYLLASGSAEVVVTNDAGLETVVATLHAGDGAGEVALLEARPRTATVRALTSVTTLALDRSDFLLALKAADVMPERVTALLRSANALRRSVLFADLAPGALQKLLFLCARENHGQGDVLIREGEAGDRFFVVESGSVVVERSGRPDPVAVLGPGQFFGEIALLCDAPRTATVTCREPSTLLSLDRQRFREVMTVDFRAGMLLEQISETRSLQEMS